MKKILLLFSLMLALIVLPSNMNAQTPYALSVQGGYSWINGVVGADFQSGNFGLSGEKISSIGVAFSAYSGPITDKSALYLSLGIASDGYRYEQYSSYSGHSTAMTAPMTILMIGERYNADNLYFKLGGGYGWCSDPKVGAWTFEVSLGFNLFSNK